MQSINEVVAAILALPEPERTAALNAARAAVNKAAIPTNKPVRDPADFKTVCRTLAEDAAREAQRRIDAAPLDALRKRFPNFKPHNERS